jgi:hypothetical protein
VRLDHLLSKEHTHPQSGVRAGCVVGYPFQQPDVLRRELEGETQETITNTGGPSMGGRWVGNGRAITVLDVTHYRGSEKTRPAAGTGRCRVCGRVFLWLMRFRGRCPALWGGGFVQGRVGVCCLRSA